MAKKTSRPKPMKNRDSRKYPQKDIKLLFGLSAGYCAFPGCPVRCILDSTTTDAKAIIGKIAHIHAHSNEGPRANPNLSSKERDSYDNWILLCGTHHDMVDAQPNTYSPDDLKKWKEDKETWVQEQLSINMPQFSFSELEVIATNISSQTVLMPSTDFNPIEIERKMKINQLTGRTRSLITLGLSKFLEVEDYIEHQVDFDPNFPERLKKGFVDEYNLLREEGYFGDSLFGLLFQFASGNNADFKRQAAGLAVLVYLFHKCEVFEKIIE